MRKGWKNMKKLFAWILILVMVMPMAFAEEQVEDPSKILVATIGDQKIYLGELENYAYQLYASGISSSYADYATAFEFLLMFKVLPALKVAEIGASNILGEDGYQKAVQSASEQFDAEIREYVNYYYGTELPEEEFDAFFAEVLLQYEAAGFSKDAYIAEFVNGEAFATYLMAQTPAVTEADVQALFDEFSETDRQLFENDVYSYEYYTNYYGYEALYTPSGYRGITHILLSADQEALDAYALSKEEGDPEKIREAADNVIAGIRDKIDLIYESLAGGAEFESLIAEFGIDPGMQNEENLDNGYAVHAQSRTYVQEFTDGAFSEKMQKVGDVSDPVVTDYGVHILYYLRDIPSGPVELTDELYKELYNYAVSSSQELLLNEWLNEYDMVIEEDYRNLLG